LYSAARSEEGVMRQVQCQPEVRIGS
jgi:hypothetical protein